MRNETDRCRKIQVRRTIFIIIIVIILHIGIIY